jgi:hypothetical protein
MGLEALAGRQHRKDGWMRQSRAPVRDLFVIRRLRPTTRYHIRYHEAA